MSLARPLLLVLSVALLGFEWQGRAARARREFEGGDAVTRRAIVERIDAGADVANRALVIRALDDEDLGVRVAAAATAERLELREAEATLLGWMDEPEGELRVAAAEALARIAEARARVPLERALGDERPEVRRAAAAGLGVLAEPASTAAIASVLGDPDEGVAVTAAGALARVGSPAGTMPLLARLTDERVAMRIAVARALGAVGDERASSALVDAVNDPAEEMRIAALLALGRLGTDDAVSALAERATAPDARIARVAIAALGHAAHRQARRAGETDRSAAPIAPSEGVDARDRTDAHDRTDAGEPDEPESPDEPSASSSSRTATGMPADPLAARPSTSSPGAIRALVTALARSDTRPLAVSALTRAAEDPNARVAIVRAATDALQTASDATSAGIADALAAIAAFDGTRIPVTPLLRALDEGRGDPRPLLRALARSDDDAALLAILERLDTPEPRVARAALDAVATRFETFGPDRRAREPLRAHVRRATGPSLAILASLLGRLRDPALRDLFLELSEDPSAAVAESALHALAQLGLAPTAPIFAARLAEARAPAIRLAAARGLAEVGDLAALRAAIARLFDRRPIDRPLLVEAIGRMTGRLGRRGDLTARVAAEARSALLTAADSADRTLAERAIVALGDAGLAGTEPELLRRARTPGDAAAPVAALALGALRSRRAVDGLRRLASDTLLPSPTRAAAATSLGDAGDVSDERLLVHLLGGDAILASGASFALARLARRDLAVESAPLCRLTRDPRAVVRANAFAALGALGGPSCDPSLRLDTVLGRVTQPAFVRRAAARYARAVLAHGHPSGSSGEAPRAHAATRFATEALETCLRREHDALVRAACELDERAVTGRGRLDLVVRDDAGGALPAGRGIAVALADGTVFTTVLGESSRVVLRDAPLGFVQVEDLLAGPEAP